jgi:hypothetical protein
LKHKEQFMTMHSDEQELEVVHNASETHQAVTEEVHEAVHEAAPAVAEHAAVHAAEPSPVVNHVAQVEAAPVAVAPATVNPDKAAMAEKIAEYTKAGINPAAVFAFGKTGILVTAENVTTISATDMTAWETAMNTYFAAHPGATS